MSSRFTFPVAGKTTIGGPFGSFRADTGAHQGNDLFADFGTPVVAVADGKLANVGSLPISGNRLWVYADSGDQFFYAHLSAFAPAAVNDRHVEKGTILGYVGNTGDAEPTPPHLHFEIHPDGGDAVDPTVPRRLAEARRRPSATPPSARARWSRSATSSERDEPTVLGRAPARPARAPHASARRSCARASSSRASPSCWPASRCSCSPARPSWSSRSGSRSSRWSSPGPAACSRRPSIQAEKAQQSAKETTTTQRIAVFIAVVLAVAAFVVAAILWDIPIVPELL